MLGVVCRFLAELEVKLHLAAECLKQNLHESSTVLVQKMSTTSTELVRTR